MLQTDHTKKGGSNLKKKKLLPLRNTTLIVAL